MDRRAAAVTEFEVRLGYDFADRGLLERALTHASVSPSVRKVDHNETLEFLGDRVLGLLAAETVLNANPLWREGDLNRRHVALVNGRACAQVGRGLGLGNALRLAGSTSSQGGRDNERILGDAMEAVMAAIYLDGGLDAARRVFNSAWAEPLSAITEARDVEAKSALQEWAMARALPIPHYTMQSRTGPAHAPCFAVEVSIPGHGTARADGPNLRAAEKAAASILLQQIQGSV